MCEDCGCEHGIQDYFDKKSSKEKGPHSHGHTHGPTKTITVEQNVLQKNNEIAHRNWHWLDDHNIKTLNLMSSPGTGKTLLLEKSIEFIADKKKVSIIVGDQQTDNDAKRMENKGAMIKQINTTSSCHLDASMIEKELGTFVTGEEDILLIENIGNLVCPAAFDLGEKTKVALLSTTEGEDKPIKYPVLFNKADLIIITKTDLIPHLDWSLELAHKYITQINPNAKVIELSAKTGEGMNRWFDYLLSV